MGTYYAARRTVVFNNLGGRMSIAIPQDEEGYIGRECPECKEYFKITPGTGLEGVSEAYCPYCGHKADMSDFSTPEQIDYVKSVALRHVSNQLHRMLKNTLEGTYPRQRSFLSIKVEVKQRGQVPLAYYTEKDLETKAVCTHCTLSYAVYSVYAFCPDCGQHNSLQIFKTNLELVQKMMKMAREGEADVREALLESCLTKVVAAFDSYGRQVCSLYAPKATQPDKAEKIRFQNLPGAQTNVQAIFGIDIAGGIEATEWVATVRMFLKRHLLAHNGGEIDDDYLARANDPTAMRGRKLTLDDKEIENMMAATRQLADYLDTQLKAQFGDVP
jgi:Zn ribbon nucleic-acid-binding protein